MQVLELNGSPLENGRMHGETFKKEIHELSDIRNELIRRYLVVSSSSEISKLAYLQIEALKKYPDFFDEFTGISQGSGLSLENLMILNNYTDMRDFDYKDGLTGSNHKIQDTGGCSSLVVKTENEYLCGQTWDMHASATPYVLKLELSHSHTEKKTHVLTLMGCLGLAGVNQNSVAVMINNMHCKETNVSLMWPALVRGMLSQGSAYQASEYLKNNIPCSGHNYLICDPDSFFNIETTGKKFDTIASVKKISDIQKEVFFHTNHYLGSLKTQEIMERQSKSTLVRYKEIEKYFNDTKDEDLNYQNISQDIFSGNKAASVCIPEPKSDPHAPMTCGGLVYDLKRKKGEAFQGSYSENKRVSIS